VSSGSEPTVFTDIPTCIHKCWSRRPRGLMRRSAAARLLGLRVRIPPGGARMSLVSVVCCQAEVTATGRSLDQRSPTGCDMTDVETSTMWRRRSVYDCWAIRNKMYPLHSWFLVALCPFPEANQSRSNVYILIRLIPCGHINVQKANSPMRINS
jgi:hypothetical protein